MAQYLLFLYFRYRIWPCRCSWKSGLTRSHQSYPHEFERTMLRRLGRFSAFSRGNIFGRAFSSVIPRNCLAISTRQAPSGFGGRPVGIQNAGVRCVKTLNFGGVDETVHERSDYPLSVIQNIFSKDHIAVIGYGPQGRGQALNLRDNGIPVILGIRRDGRSWRQASHEGWVDGKDLFDIEEACQRGTFIVNLLSDAAQKELWPVMRQYLTKGKTLCFSHGFSIVYGEYSGVKPPKDVDVVMVAPKGSGYTVRTLFQAGRGINASYAVEQDFSGNAHDRARAYAFGVGCGYLYPTEFKKEVESDLVGERGSLMGAIHGLFLAQYEVLRERGHTPSEAFNETVEEATQSLYPLIGAHGMDWMYANCSTTAQRGALDWYERFKDAIKPVMNDLYDKVASGEEAKRSLEENGRQDYRERLEKELKSIREMEIWRTGKTVRSLRPEYAEEKDNECVINP